jgi:hypothetical protein
VLGLTSFDEDDLYAALDDLCTRQEKIERALYRRYQSRRGAPPPRLFLYDVDAFAAEKTTIAINRNQINFLTINSCAGSKRRSVSRARTVIWNRLVRAVLENDGRWLVAKQEVTRILPDTPRSRGNRQGDQADHISGATKSFRSDAALS